ncbi:uncharacterized protein LOC134536913 [Bacillus rossius redtenbacheri]|uniref:uncharacterized protein LOC134536913 n=1 Tax=Bacillus rossius redtenbacheri TaxID=93214 RepID=UPI002FDD05C8
MTSLDIQLAEQDEGIHSDIDYDFFESEQTSERSNDEREGQEESGRAVHKLGDDATGEANVTGKENTINADNCAQDASSRCDARRKHVFSTKAVIESGAVREESVRGVTDGEGGTRCSSEKTKLVLNLQSLTETRSDGTAGPASRRLRQEGQKTERCSRRDSGKYRELMNCIAFQTHAEDPREEEEEDGGSPLTSSPFASSLSSDTTSDLTDVTPRSLGSCSSVLRYLRDDARPSPHDEKPAPMRLLADAIRHLHRTGGSVISNSSSGSGKSAGSRLSMTFTNEEVRKIERENGLLLKKIQSNRKPHQKPGTALAGQPRLSSSAINRRRMQQRIDHDNMILMKKIQNVKVAINTGVIPKLKRR